MSDRRRTTVYLEPALHRALRLEAPRTERSVSDVVNAALGQAIAEEAIDLEDFEQRREEKSIPFETFLRGLRLR
jgi:hypothetical protein